MTTKAHEFRAQAERSGPKKAKRPASKLTKAPGKRGVGATAKRHPSGHAERRGGPALEDSATKPSRKSTRKSVDHTKRTTNQQLKAKRKSSSPTSVAERAKSRSGKR